MADKPNYTNKIGKIITRSATSIEIEDSRYPNKPKTYSLENGGKIHGMLGDAKAGDAGEYNSRKDGFLVFWKTTKKGDAPELKVSAVHFSPPPIAETNARAEKAGFVVTPLPVVDIAGDAIEQAQARVDAANAEKEKTLEEIVKAAMLKMNPSDRVGARISLNGAINSVIEIHKLQGSVTTIEEVKREATELFLWMDEMTTSHIKRGN